MTFHPLRLFVIAVMAIGLTFFHSSTGAAERFIPSQPVMEISNVRPGMRGYLLTVLRGTQPERLPLEIVSVIRQAGPLKNMVMVRLLPTQNNRMNKVAQGMSGSPVYIEGRLIGALSMGWDFSDHETALVTPIADMSEIFSWPDRPVMLNEVKRSLAGASSRSSILRVGGLGQNALTKLKALLNTPLEVAPYGAAGELPVEMGTFAPGGAIIALLAWGDVEVGATGTVTATSKEGRFLAFGHPFLERGAVNFPVAKGYVHDTVFSQVFPFKLATPTAIIGTATQDRAAGVGGRTDFFVPSISASLKFKDLDFSERQSERKFRVAPDPFLAAKLLEGIYGGLFDDLWGRRGQGTATVTLRVEAKGLERGWSRTNVFFSDTDISSAALKEAGAIIQAFLLQPFKELFPVNFTMNVAVTEEPRVLSIENVEASADAKPGDTLTVDVVLRPWRRGAVRKRFELTIPKEASGTCELLVRGGGNLSLSQQAVEGGWKSINGLDRLIAELNAIDANNELYVELLCDLPKTNAKKDARDGDKKSADDLLPEEKEFLSETKKRRIKEGTLRIFRTEYLVDGVMRRLIDLGEEETEK